RLWSGQEVNVTSDDHPMGDLLVYGPLQPIAEGSDIDDVLEQVRAAKGFAIAAHIGAAKGLREHVGDFPLAAAEVWNGRYGPKSEKLSRTHAEQTCLPLVGGSDAHDPDKVGSGATQFSDSFEQLVSLNDLGRAIQAGRCEPWKPPKSTGLRAWWNS